MKIKTITLPALILCLICFCVTGLLVLTNSMTKDKIAQAAAEKESQSRMLVLPTATDFESVQDGVYAGKDGDAVVGYVFVTESNGYGGAVSVMTGIDNESNITGIVILSQNETPGLGANCTNESFTSQFKQEATELQVVKNEAGGNGKIQAITGSTITTKAVTNAVNEAVSIYNEVKVGANNG